ncbi:MAG: glycosyltransferase family 2 protein [Acidobacteriia bacterium]|nr:glycosyltransferase family 2 protein [Terriglobia bacterium]
MLLKFILFSNYSLFFYYLASNLIYLALLIIALMASLRHRRRLASIRLDRLRHSPLAPPITLLAPAHNEEKSIIESARGLLALDYPELELIVINDGSTDRTLDVLAEYFQLRPADLLYIPEIPSAPVRGVYMSQNEPRLLVVDKEPGGNKADAVNAGLNAASKPYVCIVDADSILERDSLLRIMVPILADPKRVVAAGGIVRVLNGSRVADGQLTEVHLPKSWLKVLQVIEYLRAFLIGREAWAAGNMLNIISGAFGIFRLDLVKAVGGYRATAIGEDFDLVTRLHRYLLDQEMDYKISFVPDPVCWTEVPADLRSLARQRSRWHKGLLDVLWPNRDMLFRPAYGRFGSISLPYMWSFELLAPVVELVGYTTIILAAVLGVLSREYFLQFLIYGYAFGTMISIGAVLQEEITYKRYNDWRDVVRLVLYCFFEHFPYRQMYLVWRLQGFWQYFRRDFVWRPMKRIGFQSGAAKK